MTARPIPEDFQPAVKKEGSRLVCVVDHPTGPIRFAAMSHMDSAKDAEQAAFLRRCAWLEIEHRRVTAEAEAAEEKGE